jgi:uncharacterized protein
MDIDTGWDLLSDHIASCPGAAVAFSGGIDSTVLLSAVSGMFPDHHVAVFADLPMLAERQRITAKNVAKELGARFVSVKLDWDHLDGIRDNGADRCYICKRGIYSAVKNIASEKGWTVMDGENSSDNEDDRPGRRAAKEFGIMSPLKEVGLPRSTVMEMYDHLNLRNAVQKETCMATRIPFGVPFNDKDIKFIDECEDLIRNISGVRQIRMRLNNGEAKLQTSPDTIRLLLNNEDKLHMALYGKGIRKMHIDLEGYKE